MQAALADFFMFKLLTGRPDTGYMTTPTHHPHPNPQWTPQCSDKPDRVLQHWLKDSACYCRGCVNSRAGHKWKVSWTGRLVKVQAFDWLTRHWLQDPPPPPPWTSQCSDKPGQLLQHWLKGCTCRCRGCTHSGVYDIWWLRCTDRLLNIQPFDWLTWH